MKRLAIMSWLLAAGLAAAASAATDAEIGTVLDRDYSGATGLRVGGEMRELFFDLPVHSAERVDTGAEARTALTFLDDTHLQVAPNSSVVLDRFIYDPDRKTGSVAMSFSRGLFRFVSGDMKNKDGFDLRTPSASLAIRGTKFILFVAADGSTVLSVIEGEVEMRPCDGTIRVVAAGESATAAATCRESSVVTGLLTPRDKAVDEDYQRFGTNQTGARNGGGRQSSGKRGP